MGMCDASDFFSIDLVLDDTLEVELIFLQLEGDLNAAIRDPSGAIVATASSATDNEFLSWVATSDGEHTIEVLMFAELGPYPGNSYEMNITLTPGVPPACADDLAEENDTEATATPVVPDLYPDLISCPFDEDWYTIPALAGDTIEIDLYFSNAAGNIDMELIDSAGNFVAEGTSYTDNEAISVVAPADDDYLIFVELFSESDGVPGNDYELDVDVSTPSAVCLPDAQEDDDSPGSATLVSPPQSFPNSTACPADMDWYQFDLSTDDVVDIAVSFLQIEGDINLELQDNTGTPVATATSSTDDETISYTAVSDGSHFLLVSLVADPGAPGVSYDLDGDVTPYVVPCIDDIAEDFDTFATAMVTPAMTIEASACPNDDDFFAVSVLAGDTLNIEVSFDNVNGNIDIELLDPSGVVVDSSNDPFADLEDIFGYVAPADGAYTVRVTLTSENDAVGGNDYLMAIEHLPLFPPCSPGDFFESNDNPGNAAGIFPALLTGLGSCPADDDFYALDLFSGDNLSVYIEHAHAEGNIDVELYDSASALLIGSYSFSNDESLAWPVVADGVYLVRVTLTADTGSYVGNFYTMDIEL